MELTTGVVVVAAIIGFFFVIVLVLYRFVFAVDKETVSTHATVPVCPKCGGIAAKGSESLSEMFDPSRMRCPDCNYIGGFLDMAPERIEEFRKHLDKKQNFTDDDYQSDFVMGEKK